MDRSGDTGKTFLYNTLLANVRSNSDIALAVASSEIVAFLISSSKIAHLWFKILIKLDSSSICNIL